MSNIEELSECEEKRLLSDTYQMYIRDVLQYPLLSKEDEQNLAHILKKNGKDSDEYKEAKEKFILSNLRFVLSIVKKYRRKETYMDLIQEGNIGLIKAVDRFEAFKNTRFTTYGAWWIRQAITRAIPEKERTIKVPSRVYEEVKVFKKEVSNLEKQLNHEVSEEEIIKYLGYSIEDIDRYNIIMNEIVSLNQLIGESNDLELSEAISFTSIDDVEDNMLRKKMKEDFIPILSKYFDSKTLYVLVRRFGLDGKKKDTLETLGKNLNISYEGVRLIEKQAIDRIINSDLLLNIFAGYTDNPEKSIEIAKEKRLRKTIK